jgi:hypothetical protein
MHPSARKNAQRFVKNYLDKHKQLKVLEVGSRDVNGSLRDMFSQHDKWVYTGMDNADGPNVDVVKPYVAYGSGAFPFTSMKFNVVVSSSCLEHDSWPWVTFKEMVR